MSDKPTAIDIRRATDAREEALKKYHAVDPSLVEERSVAWVRYVEADRKLCALTPGKRPEAYT